MTAEPVGLPSHPQGPGSAVPLILVDLSVAASGGAATYAASFAEGLIKSADTAKNQVFVLLDQRWAHDHVELVESLMASGAQVVVEPLPLPGTWRARLSRGRTVARLVRDRHIEVAFFPRDAAPRLRVPIVVLLNNRYAWGSFATGQAIGGKIPALLLRLAALLAARRAASVLAVSEAMGSAAKAVRIDEVIHHGCWLPEHPRVIETPIGSGEPGTPLGEHPTHVSTRGSVEPFAGGEGAPIHVLMIGNLIENKQVEVVIEGVAEARRRGGTWDMRVYGDRMDPAYADRVEALSQRLLGESVIHDPIGHAELVRAYQRADLLVMGGAFESFCHPLVEGMRSGCVVVAPDTALVREICGSVAVLYRESDPADLARALAVAAGERAVRSRLGIEWSRSFDWVDTVDRTLAAVRRVAVGRPTQPALSPDERTRARVLIDMSVAPPGGAATYVDGFAHGLAVADISNKDRIVVVVDAYWARGHPALVEAMRTAGVDVVCRDFPRPGTWRARLGRGRILRDAARRAGVHAAFFPRDLAPPMSVPVVILTRNLYAWQAYATGAAIGGRIPAYMLRVEARRSARRAAVVLAVSGEMARLVTAAPVAGVIHHGCLMPEHPRPKRSGPGRPTVVVNIGNLMENKGVGTIIEGVAVVRGLDDHDWDLRVHGKRSDSAYAAAMEQLSVDRLGASALNGPVYGDELLAAYQAADIVVVGTTFESFCHPLVEGMRSGCVVVAPAGALVAEICGDVAVTYPEHDPQGLAEALLQARAELGDRSARGVERSRMFTWEQAATQTVAAVRAAVTRSGADVEMAPGDAESRRS